MRGVLRFDLKLVRATVKGTGPSDSTVNYNTFLNPLNANLNDPDNRIREYRRSTAFVTYVTARNHRSAFTHGCKHVCAEA